MRVSSSFSATERRNPQQERAALRRVAFLEAAAALIGEVGYDAATMTAVAERAGASIGTLYDYFPDKKAVCVALLLQYAAEVEEHWAPLLARAGTLKPGVFADSFIESMLEFVRERPAYLPLTGTQLGFSRDLAGRRARRSGIAKALQAMNPKVTAEKATLAANVTLQVTKGLIAVYKEAGPKERRLFTAEFQKVLRLYLTATLGK